MAIRFKACEIEGCNGNAHRDGSGKRGYCNKHYIRMMKYGDPHYTKFSEPGAPMAFIEELCGRNIFPDECIAWPHGKKQGYGCLKVAGQPVGAHRVICERVHGTAPTPKHEVCHSCGRGIEGCVNPAHLRWGTHQENMLDVYEHGSRSVPRGEQLSWAKLSEDDVRAIRRALASGRTQQSVADEYGVRQSHIGNIAMGRKWAWLT